MSRETYALVYQTIKDNPGLTMAQVAEKAGITKSAVQNDLIYMPNEGYLIYEDDNDRLYVLEIIKWQRATLRMP